VFKTYDADGNETIDMCVRSSLVAALLAPSASAYYVHAAAERTLYSNEMQTLIDELNIPMRKEEIQQLFDVLDTDNSGGIAFEEFYAWLVRLEHACSGITYGLSQVHHGRHCHQEKALLLLHSHAGIEVRSRQA
jgi:hypothetical protein